MAALCGLSLSLTVVPAARAAPPGIRAERSVKLSEEAQAAYLDGRFDEAIRLYLMAYDALPDPGILYNIGFVYERKLDDPELALGYYERVATAPDVPEELAAKAAARLEGVRQVLADRKKPPPIEKPPPPEEPPAEGPTGDVRWAPVLTMAVGGAALLGGAVMGSLALDAEGRYANARDSGDTEGARSWQSTGRGQAFAADVLFIAGGATAAAGLIWFLIDGFDDAPADKPTPTTYWRFSPTTRSPGAFVSFGGAL